MSRDKRQLVRHMLSFDVEEYFHCEAFRGVIASDGAADWPSRIDGQMDKVLGLLAETDARATFFVLGRVAVGHPRLVRRIADAGHEIACHGHSHQMVARLSEEGFRQDTRVAKVLLEDITGHRVLGYRAATFGLVRRTAWAIDILAELGLEYDSSVQPVRHDRYGVPEAPPQAHLARGPGGGEILEVPPMTRRFAGQNIPLGGGGYFRLLPVVVFDRALHAWSRAGRPAMLYLHPWEFDPDQPVVPASWLDNFRHRVNLNHTAGKLRSLLAGHAFSPVRELLGELRSAAARFEYAESAHS